MSQYNFLWKISLDITKNLSDLLIGKTKHYDSLKLSCTKNDIYYVTKQNYNLFRFYLRTTKGY
ncbi:hypothetical protein SACC_27490 [Saccharolobus caldissimus]|uniref:Uncharacterized protein n=1 Tax=Saccharolobus caldissimus TaxID=1702097 RepID=A0AAQ4CVA1_9CREN|nr:hypothetical protein SACC_27490 [Saccharolobus caldissimus]